MPPSMPSHACPYCSYTRFWKLRRAKLKCKQCRREYAQRRYPVEGIRATADEWHAVISAFLRERTIRAVMYRTDIGYRRTQRMLHTIRVRMTQEQQPIFCGPVELDETYIGAQRKNQRLHIRKRYPPKRGHGTQKLPILGLFDRKSGCVRVEVLPKKLDINFIRSVVKAQVKAGAKLYTDGFNAYVLFEKDGYVREFVNHHDGEYVRGDVHTNNIEGFWGILKRTMGTIGGMRRDRLPLFAAEIEWRFNHRNEAYEEKERALLELVLQR